MSADPGAASDAALTAEAATRPTADAQRDASQWTLALVPAFPIVLLVLKLWHLSGKDLNTMLLLVQNVHPVELATSLVFSLLEVPPAIVLVAHALGLLSLVSGGRPTRSRLEIAAERVPGPVVALAGLWALLVWQVRFLPLALMLLCAIAGLRVRLRGRTDLVWPVCFLLPVAVGVTELALLTPAAFDAAATGDFPLVACLLVPPLLAPLLTGPLPPRSGPTTAHALALVGALGTPFLLLALFLRAPVLPSVALLLEPEARGRTAVVLGNVVTVDDTATTVLDARGDVQFIRNDHVESKVLCPGEQRIPSSSVTVHGWLVEHPALDWLLPAKVPQGATDPLCDGRLPSAG
ncbi:hypothetical protein KCV87_02370 [Actinosynnema pretiosum subsp. pretiosum]|uniref:Uncharacterized protein n=2 Tax=Actinosynnema TaxID=40566 RepID=C6WAW2_ACTMD|nr:hypothetical protein [Actinosynnema mirum]ACU37431.1 hypothetical protein Amir_3539 [Actinosynnema mirum DSM 43827]AXX30903.1 hypothetical protein APASM_3538 [Actinosynnema pretiosum subsp. pretiosum]QUF04995.1 hypothetical protein KCV87_02370 [Actinosynnema pretiosum subsp. pretiosum]